MEASLEALRGVECVFCRPQQQAIALQALLQHLDQYLQNEEASSSGCNASACCGDIVQVTQTHKQNVCCRLALLYQVLTGCPDRTRAV